MDSDMIMNKRTKSIEDVSFTQESDDHDDELIGGLTLKEMRRRVKLKRKKIVKSDIPPSRVQLQSSQKKSDLDEPLSVLKHRLQKKSLQMKNTKARVPCISNPSYLEETGHGTINNELRKEHFDNFEVISDVVGKITSKVHRSTKAVIPDARFLRRFLRGKSGAIHHLIQSPCIFTWLEACNIKASIDKMHSSYFQTVNECFRRVRSKMLTAKTSNTIDKNLLTEMEGDSRVIKESNGILNPSSLMVIGEDPRVMVMEENFKVMEESKDCSNKSPLIVMEDDPVSKMLEESKDSNLMEESNACLNPISMMVIKEDSKMVEESKDCLIQRLGMENDPVTKVLQESKDSIVMEESIGCLNPISLIELEDSKLIEESKDCSNQSLLLVMEDDFKILEESKDSGVMEESKDSRVMEESKDSRVMKESIGCLNPISLIVMKEDSKLMEKSKDVSNQIHLPLMEESYCCSNSSLLIAPEKNSKVIEEFNGCSNQSSLIVVEDDLVSEMLVEESKHSILMEESNSCLNPIPMIVLEEGAKLIEESKDCTDESTLIVMEDDSKVFEESKDSRVMEEDSRVLEETKDSSNQTSPFMMEEDSMLLKGSQDSRMNEEYNGCLNPISQIEIKEDSKLIKESKDCLNERSLVVMEESKESLDQCCFESDSVADLHSIVPKGQTYEETFNFNQVEDFKQTPKKLLSNRKVISPASQESLCCAFKTEKLYESMPFSSSRKRILQLLDMSGNTNERMIKKQKSDTDTKKSILKPPNSSFSAQAAANFSQKQMRDTKAMTGKLVDGLRFMKDAMLKNTTISDLDESANEIKIAIEKASALEATAEKCMSMMIRDCKRFCQLMRPLEQKIPTKQSNSNNHKKQRKVTFADEVGKPLSHIKIFIDQTNPGDRIDG